MLPVHMALGSMSVYIIVFYGLSRVVRVAMKTNADLSWGYYTGI